MFQLKNALIKGLLLGFILFGILKAGIMYSDYSVLKYKESQAELVESLRKELAIEISKNTTITQDNLKDLLEAKNTYEKAVIDINNEYSGRMFELEKRAEYYRSMSKPDTTTCGDLGDVTTRLDRNLEEGRKLVIDLRERLVLREEQIKIIGKQLLADRKLLGQEH